MNDATTEIIKVLYIISNTLLTPVVLILLVMLALTIVALGEFAREYIERNRRRKKIESHIQRLKKSHAKEIPTFIEGFFRSDGIPHFIESFINDAESCQRYELTLEKIIDDIEIAMNRKISKTSIGVRLGPMLGLIGTLVPLGPALVGLKSGNINQLSNNLVVAFTTTVIGLLIGGICYIITIIRKGWYSQDISDIDCIYQSVFFEISPNKKVMYPCELEQRKTNIEEDSILEN